MYSSNYTSNGEEIGFAYKMEGKEIGPVSSEGNSYYGGIDLTYERGKLICTIKIDFPRDTAMFIEFPTDSKEEGTLTLKYIYKEGNVPAIPPPPPPALAGKTFAYEKVEVEFENKEAEEFVNKLLTAGQSVGDYFAKNMLGDELKTASFSFKDGKMYGNAGKLLEYGIEYKLQGKMITFVGLEGVDMDGMTFTYEDGKLVLNMEINIPTGPTTKSKIALKILYAEK